jgi:hypothetical protein
MNDMMLEMLDIKAFPTVSFRLSMKSEKKPSKNVIMPWSGLG